MTYHRSSKLQFHSYIALGCPLTVIRTIEDPRTLLYRGVSFVRSDRNIGYPGCITSIAIGYSPKRAIRVGLNIVEVQCQGIDKGL